MKRTKSGPQIRFFTIFSSVGHQSSFKLHRIIAWNKVKLLVEVKLTNKTLGAQIWGKGPKMGPEINFFANFSSLVDYFYFKLCRMIAWNNV